jgi:hypothetical protein
LTSAALNTTGASLLVVTFSTYGGDAPTLTDSKGNTWHFVTGAPSGVSRGRIAYAWNKGAGALSTGTGHTITIQDSAASGTAYTFMAFWGIQTVSDPSYGTTNSASITTGTTVQPGIVTPSIGDLVIASLGHYPGGVSGYTATVDSSYTIPCGNTGAAGSGPYADNWGAYIIAPSGSDLDPTWTVGQAFAPGHSGSTMAIGFKHA